MGYNSINVILFRIKYIKYIDKLFKFMFHIDNLLKLLILFLPRKKLDLRIRTLWPVHTAQEQSHTNLIVYSVH